MLESQNIFSTMTATLSNRRLLQIVVAMVIVVNFLNNLLQNDLNRTKTYSAPAAIYDLAKHESLDFFDDIESAHWELLKQKVADMSPNYDTFYLPYPGKANPKQIAMNKIAGHFYQNHYEPEFVCMHERRIGKLGDGGKWICDPHRIAKQDDCLVYSIGSNNDFSFEQAILDNIGQHCEIHTVSIYILLLLI